MLLKRLATAAVLVPLVILGTLMLSNTLFALCLAFVVALGAWEYSQLIQIKPKYTKVLYSITVTATALVCTLYTHLLLPLLIASTAWWSLNVLWIVLYPKCSSCWYSNWGLRQINGFIIFVPMLVALTALQKQSPELVLFLLVLIWSADSGAFFVGKSIGKHKLCPKVSPGKTIEGAIGGVGAALIVALLYAGHRLESATSNDYLLYVLLAFIVALASIVGDLFESLFKRIANIKDSGNSLPGHGGIFDRIDSLTAAAPLFYLANELLV